MAEKDIVGGIFGLTPEMYQQNIVAKDTATNVQLAQLTPGQLAGFYGMEAGTGLGRAAQGLLGVEDPQLKMIRDAQAMRANYDVSTPQGLRDFAQALSNKGYTNFAMEAAKAADAREKTISETGKIKKETELFGREYKEIGVDPRNPELVIKALVDKEGNVIKTVGEPYSRFTAKTNVNVTGPKNVLEIDKQEAEDYLKRFKAAEGMLPVLDRMDNLIKSNVVQGPAADFRVNSLKVFDALGLNTDAAKKVTANSEQFNKEVATLAEKTLKLYGTNPSNVDVKANLQKIPQLTQSPEGMAQLLSSLTKATRDEYNESRRALDYYRNKSGSFAGFERQVPLLAQDNTANKITLPPGKSLNDLSLKEIKDLLAKQAK